MRVVSLVPSVTETLLAWGVTPVGVTRFCEQPQLPAVGGTKDPDVAAIVALGPDVVVMDEEENRREDADVLRTAGITVHVTSVRSVADVTDTLTRLAGRVEVDASPMAVPERARARRSAFVPIWRRPWMTINADTYGSDLLAHAGIENVFAGAADRYPTVTIEEAVARAPDVVLAPSEPYPFGHRHVHELSQVAPVELVDGQDLFWWGVRTPAALARLSAR